MLGIVFPHQCFQQIPSHWTEIVFVRHDIGYGGKQTTVKDFHIARKVFLRAVEKAWLQEHKGRKLRIVERGKAWGTKEPCEVWDPVDRMLETELKKKCPRVTFLPTPAFLLSAEESLGLLGPSDRSSHANFYAAMRKRTGILMRPDGTPEGGKFRWDELNREKVGADVKLPDWDKEVEARQSQWIQEAAKEIEREGGGLGEWTGDLVFPTTYEGADAALKRFLKSRLAKFGPYEDAIVQDEDFLFHSVLSAPLNAGLLTPAEVLTATLNFAKHHTIPLESLEGFIAQILGWREYMRAVYLRYPIPKDRLGHKQGLTKSWYNGTTGLLPVDTAIQRVNQNAYLHHIERLMVVGNAMFLCEIKPTEVYRWFMEMFADSWDWVMVGNVYFMSQWTSDAITTKPYISSSAYLHRMSDYKKGEWSKDWDALYWNTVKRLAPLLKKNYRMAAQVAFYEKKTPTDKREIQERVRSVMGRL